MAKPPSKRPPSMQPPPAGGFIHTQVKAHVGPIPSPEDLAHYDQLHPGAAGRIIAMAEAEQRHRHTMEQAQIVSDQRHRDDVLAAQKSNGAGVFRSDLVGLICGWSIGIACVAGAIYSVKAGAYWPVTIAFVSLPIAGIIKAVRSFNGKVEKKKP